MILKIGYIDLLFPCQRYKRIQSIKSKKESRGQFIYKFLITKYLFCSLLHSRSSFFNNLYFSADLKCQIDPRNNYPVDNYSYMENKYFVKYFYVNFTKALREFKILV